MDLFLKEELHQCDAISTASMKVFILGGEALESIGYKGDHYCDATILTVLEPTQQQTLYSVENCSEAE